MTTKLIELEDGTLIEVEAQADLAQRISGGLAEKVAATFERIEPILVNACRPVVAACERISEETVMEKAELELGLSFEGEGNLYITKSKAGANITVRLTITPRSGESQS